ncbi:DNA replication/repair protein RecF [Stappia taiwanensis]|uniref:DNA replication and repair protein RecF n=1 Tax=Stappia taiwanensis TaxID=992267 RepID=A0A838XY98_9HYPH|nr:DNA replication/repair protein RecF [Stappia taiwanensis]MBA4613426.1 DNA replication/repair protein RecF [Stappia taiwanensis]GGF02224.1 DNA replication and repair protein RecF [Stappia taiwanensis]
MSGPVHVALRRLALTNFRSYETFSLTLDAPLVAFVGENGAGKTNLLEAVSLLTAGRGLRRAPLGEIARKGSSGDWSVAAVVDGPQGETRIGVGHRPGETGRRIRIDGADARNSEQLLDYLRVLWLLPSMDGLFTGPAGDRRRFLDRFVLAVDPGHGRRVADLEKTLRARNRLLDGNGAPEFLDAVEAQLAPLAVAVCFARRETVALLAERVAAQASLGLPFPQAGISLDGPFEEEADACAAGDLEDRYRARLVETRRRDRAAGRTLDGPHRSDLKVHHLAKDMPAGLASTGEQKALLIGLVLAHAEVTAAMSGMTPLLLLDEVAAHLDPNRRAALFARLAELGPQVLMTGTDPLLFSALPRESEVFQVASGSVTPYSPG